MLHDLVPGVQAISKFFAELQLVSGVLVADAEDKGVILMYLTSISKGLLKELSFWLFGFHKLKGLKLATGS
jgi:hypothetical protein